MKKVNYLFYIILSITCFNILNVDASVTYKQGIVTSSSTIKSEGSSSSSNLKSDTGASMKLSSPEAVEVVGENDSYYQIKFIYSGFFYTGWVPKNNVKVATYNTDDAYTESLVKAGFPKDYADKLSIIHAIHPNWTFSPSMTGKTSGGLDFFGAVNGEADPVSKNLISSSNTSLRSTADGAYKNGEWISLSGAGWYAASTQTIAFFLDPRNFLNESNIFMFENLGYNPVTQTKDSINNIIKSTFLNNPFNCNDGANSCSVGTHTFIDTFMEVGSDKGVSPVHLASRVVQEQGSSGSVLSLGNGYNGNYVGYYNFFNIGASGISTEDVIINGLSYAYNRNWNNQRVSIYEGSSFIATNYVGVGQSTLYYQKFNTIYTGSLYSHQYMQNIKAPYSEGYNTYVGYYNSFSSQSDWNNASYDFLIPVYSNMPEYTSLDTSGNSDATLSSLSVTSCNLNPSFQSSAYNYDCYVSTSTSSVTVSSNATNALASVSGNGVINLNNNDNTIEIVVTAANGNKSSYLINVHKIETDGYSPTEIMNGIGIKVTGNFINNIDVGSDISNIINNINNKYHFTTVNAYSSNGNQITNGTIKTGDKINISNAGLNSSFTIVIYGDTSGDGSIDIRDLLIIQKHLVKSSTIGDAYLKSADINKDGTVDIRDLLLEQKSLLGAYSISQV